LQDNNISKQEVGHEEIIKDENLSTEIEKEEGENEGEEEDENEEKSTHKELDESEDPDEKRRVKNPRDKISKKSREKFITNYVNSDDDIDEDESRDMLEKYQKLFMYFKTYAEKPEKFDEDTTKKLKKQTI
jgi:hypothetical protein